MSAAETRTVEPTQPAAEIEYYRIDSRKVSFREYWNLTRSWAAVVLWLMKLCRIRVPFPTILPHIKSPRSLEVPEDQVPAALRLKVQRLITESIATGFTSPRFSYLNNPLCGAEGVSVVLVHQNGEAICSIQYALNKHIHPPFESSGLAIVSELADGSFIATSNERETFRPPPRTKVVRCEGATAEALWGMHQRRLRKAASPPKQFTTEQELQDFLEHSDRELWDFRIKRGLFVRMSEEEVAAARKKFLGSETAQGEVSLNAAVLAELREMQNPKGRPGMAVIVLALSLFVFTLVGAQQWSWGIVLTLVPILLFHEFGHYFAMRAFKYRNMRMLFVPFLGAVVTGRQFNVPGWKKCIVYLMGPVPGIIVGLVLGWVALAWHKPMLLGVAIMALILNGFNLLPVLPLDGGGIVHILLFGRHRMLDRAFRVFAVGGLLAIGFSFGAFLALLAIPMALSIPGAWKLADITAALRARGIEPVSPDDQTIPEAIAQIIIEEVKQAFPKTQTAARLAERTWSVFENLNAKPPGWRASIAFVAVYLASIAPVILFIFKLTGGFLDRDYRWWEPASSAPEQVLAVNGLNNVYHGPRFEPDTALHEVVVASLTDATGARALWREVTNGLPESAAARVFGNSVFLALPPNDVAAQKSYFNQFRRKTDATFCTSKKNFAHFTLTCEAPDAATATEIENAVGRSFFHNDDAPLIPPWLPVDRRTEPEKQRHELARATYAKLIQAELAYLTNSALDDLQSKIKAAATDPGSKQLTELYAETALRARESHRRELEKLKGSEPDKLDLVLIDLYNQMRDSSPGSASPFEEMARMAQRMGQIQLGNIEDLKFACKRGAVTRDGLSLQFNWIMFYDVFHGAPALVKWLEQQGCTRFTYKLTPGGRPDP